MKEKNNALRLVFPQWQGGIINSLVPELSWKESTLGYSEGANLLNFLAPDSDQEVAHVPVSLDIENINTVHGISSYTAIITQTQAALEILDQKQPEKIITLGGECAVSVVPFTYLSNKYDGDVAVVWLDAHPDLNLPGDKYAGYHAMALSAIIGEGDSELLSLLPCKVDPKKVLIAGLRSSEPQTVPRKERLSIESVSPADIKNDSVAVLNWLKSTGVKKVVIHFDLDVLDPNEIVSAVGIEPDGMKMNEVVRLINDISQVYEIVGLTVAEFMPRVAIKIKSLLEKLPLFR